MGSHYNCSQSSERGWEDFTDEAQRDAAKALQVGLLLP